MAKKSAGGKKGGKKGGRKGKRTWGVYVGRSLRAIHKGMTLSSKTVKVVNSFINDIFDRIASQAGTLARVNKRRTLGSREIQTAVRLVLPAELARHAAAEATKAVAKLAA